MTFVADFQVMPLQQIAKLVRANGGDIRVAFETVVGCETSRSSKVFAFDRSFYIRTPSNCRVSLRKASGPRSGRPNV
jgi:hypothetical protein